MQNQVTENLSKKDLIEIIGKCWMTHDGMWFYNTYMHSGIENANKINKAAIQSLAPMEINRFKKLLGVESIKNYDHLKFFFSGVSELLIPEFMNIIWEFSGNGIVSWRFNEKKCFAFNGISLLGVIDQYECGPIYRIRCWLDHLNLQYTIEPSITKCIMPSQSECSGKIIFHNLAC